MYENNPFENFQFFTLANLGYARISMAVSEGENKNINNHYYNEKTVIASYCILASVLTGILFSINRRFIKITDNNSLFS
ncbi:hypothetical protein [Fluviispira sanaruensis]|uniref:Uncharacterized protein n=1 Tax=Fluviispira sanaruensis TaxID=2493639 RepID=A0A4P2VLU4_FLUSA|nr:hypothetical protein [Fluviispira sanaruensis]BBH52369.1 hypothetical protein JCM31447_316600 [Fluviispira sanaruensis]